MTYTGKNRTDAYRGTMTVINGEIRPDDATSLEILKQRLATANRERRARARLVDRLDADDDVIAHRVTLCYRGPRHGHYYVSTKQTAYAVDVYVHPRRVRLSRERS